MIAVDPGSVRSAYVIFEPLRRPGFPPGIVHDFGIPDNGELERMIDLWGFRLAGHYAGAGPLVIEKAESFGKVVWEQVFESVYWTGRFARAWGRADVERIGRVQVKMQLCGVLKGVNDAVLRQRLIGLWGGREAALGRKGAPGPLRGIVDDTWQALALAVAWSLGLTS